MKSKYVTVIIRSTSYMCKLLDQQVDRRTRAVKTDLGYWNSKGPLLFLLLTATFIHTQLHSYSPTLTRKIKRRSASQKLIKFYFTRTVKLQYIMSFESYNLTNSRKDIITIFYVSDPLKLFCKIVSLMSVSLFINCSYCLRTSVLVYK